MKKIIFALMLIACILLTGCTNTEQVSKEQSEVGSKAEGSLSVYALQSDDKVDAYIKDFNIQHKNVKVEKRGFETQEEMDETVKTELNAGKGPDVIIFDARSSLDLVKLAKNGAFMPLDDKISQNDNLKAENYLPGTLDAGKVDGKQYLLPLTVTFPAVMYNADEEIGLEAAPVLSYDAWAQALESNLARFQNDSERCASMGGHVIEFALLSSGVLPLTGDSQELNKDKIKAVTELIKKWDEDRTQKREAVLKYGESAVADHYALYSVIVPDLLNEAWARLGYHQYVKQENFTVSVVKPSEEEGLIPRVASSGVLTKNAGEVAYDFLRSAIDCYARSNAEATYGMSPNKSVIQKMIETYEKQVITKNTQDGASIVFGGLNPQMSGSLKEIFEAVTEVKIYNQKIIDIYTESFTPYLQGEKAYEDCYTEFENKIKLYFSE